MTTLNTVGISGTFDDGSQSPLNGTAVFTPSAVVHSSGVPVLLPDVPVKGEIVAGQLKNLSGSTLTLVATDNAGLTVEGLTGWWYWQVQITIGDQVLEPWSFFLPYGTLGAGPVDLYSLANTGAGGGGGGITPPAGDIGGTTSAPTVTGTHLSAPMPLAQGGTGQNAGNAAALLAALGAAPLASPALTGSPTAPTQTTGDNSTKLATDAFVTTAVAAETTRAQTAEGLLIPLAQKGAASGVATLGAGSLVPQAQLAPGSASKYAPLLYGAVWGYAHQFWPDNRGAKGDGKIVTDAVMTSASNVLACTSSAPFASGDVGKHVLVSTAAGAYAPLHATITGFTDSAHVTLSANATATTTGTPGAICYFGTDDLAALQSQVNAAASYMAAHGYAEMLLDPSLVYILGGAFTVGGAGLGNNQLALPNIAQASQHGILAILAGADSAPLINWAQLVPEAPGAVLASVRTDGTNDATYGPAHIIGGPVNGYGGESGASTGWNNLHLITRGLSTLSPYNATFGGMDLFSVASCDIQSFSALCAAVVPASSDAAPSMASPANISNQWGWGLRMPSAGNNAAASAGHVRCEGHCYGYGPSEHSVTQDVRAVYDITGIESYAGNGIAMTHAATIVKATVEGTLNATGYLDGVVHMDILCLDAESAGTIVYDPANRGQGYIGLRNQGDAGAYRNDYKNGGSGIRVVNLLTTPGFVGSPPAVSASATGNYYWRDATVWVSGGTVTSIAVDGTTLTGVTSGPVRVPSGHSITLAYSAAPSWQWELD